jgi:putative aminopeptidase FrvX
MFDKLNQLAKELKPQAVDFCQRLIRVPALSGEEKGVADLYLAEMEKLGYDEVFRDDFGNVFWHACARQVKL